MSRKAANTRNSSRTTDIVRNATTKKGQRNAGSSTAAGATTRAKGRKYKPDVSRAAKSSDKAASKKTDDSGSAVTVKVISPKNNAAKTTKAAKIKTTRAKTAGAKTIEAVKTSRMAGAAGAAEIKTTRAKTAETEATTTTEPTRTAKTKKLLHPRRHTMPTVLRVILSIILLAGLATLFTWYIFCKQYGDADAAGAQIGEKPLVFTYSAILVFLLMAILAAATWRPFFSAGLSFVIISILLFINTQKMLLRNAPLLPEELLLADQAGNIASFVDGDSIRRLILGSILVLIGSILLEFYARKVIGRDRAKLPWWDKTALIPRITFVMLGLAGFSIVAQPVIHRKTPDWVEGMKYVGWNQTENYQNNGFVIGFLNNIAPAEVPRPDNYAEETMLKIADKYQAIKEADTARKSLNEIAENIIIILDETFYDPEVLTKYYQHTGGDVTPNLHRIFQKYPSGYMYSPEYGGNTANVEFEVQTSLSNYWAQSLVYLNLVPKTGGLPSVVEWAQENDFSTTAIHSYDAAMYKRDIVYPLLGYDDFISAAEMSYTEKEGESEYINDRSVFNEILDLIQDEDKPQMIGVVTMQNHGAYDGAKYQEVDFIINHGNYLLEQNYQSIHNADEYLGEFIDALSKLDEKTVVLWYGDHAAGILNDFAKSDDKVDKDTAHLTPYFIYANFDLDYQGDVAEIAKQRANLGIEINLPDYLLETINLPLTTPNCLANTMLNVLGAEKPSRFYLIDDVCAEIPILASSYWNGNNPAASEKAQEIFDEYRLMNYDLLSGKQYWW